MPKQENWYYKRTRTQNILLIIIMTFIIFRLVSLMWNSPFYHTPTDKGLNVIKGVGIGVVFLGFLYLLSYKRGTVLRGERPSDTEQGTDWLILFPYLTWIILWEFLDLLEKTKHPSLRYGAILVGMLIITYMWFEIGSMKDSWWKIIE